MAGIGLAGYASYKVKTKADKTGLAYVSISNAWERHCTEGYRFISERGEKEANRIQEEKKTKNKSEYSLFLNVEAISP